MAGYYKEQAQNITATPEELDAWEALRREPGLRGRLARRGKHMKPSYVGGRRSFQPNAYESGRRSGGEDRGAFETRPDVIQSRNTEAGRSGDYSGHQNQQSRGGGGGSSNAELQAANARAKTLQKEFDEYKSGEEGRISAAKEGALEEWRDSREGQLLKDYGGYKDDLKQLRSDADYTTQRGQIDTLRGDARKKFGDYESAIGKMTDRGSQVAGLVDDSETLRSDVGDVGDEMGTMADEATDTQKLMKDRSLYTGMLEDARKTGQDSKLANLRRSMASAGSSPEEIARAEAEATGGAGGMRSDQLQGAMMAMQARQGQLGQRAGFLGQQAALRGQQAGMLGQEAGFLGQAQNLGLQKIGQQANMANMGIQNQANLVGQNASMQQNQINQQAALTAGMSGQTDNIMSNIIYNKNLAQEKDLAERGLLMQQQANQANRTQGPSQQDQFMNLLTTGATVKMAFGCIPEGTTIDLTDGGIAVEDLKVGMKIKGWHGGETEILQVHQYKEDPAPHRFYHIEFDNGGAVDVSALHRIYGKRAKDFKVGDKVQSHKITSITKYNGVEVSYDLLTKDVGYRIGDIPVDSMIEEMAEAISDLNKIAA